MHIWAAYDDKSSVSALYDLVLVSFLTPGHREIEST